VSSALSGVVPILVTPFLEDDGVDHAGLRREVAFLVEQGVQAVAFGFGSEVFRLGEDERDEALATVVDEVDGRLPVVGSGLAGSTHAGLARVRRALELGADAVMVVPPAHGATDDESLFEHFSALAGVGLPLVVQDAPGMSGVELSVPLLGRLARELAEVVSLKLEAPPTGPKIERVLEVVAGHVTVLGGGGGLELLDELDRGADGTMPGPATPELFARVWSLRRAGRRAEARTVFHRLLPVLVVSLRSLDTFLFVQKEILRRRGVLVSARLRAPSTKPEPALVRELESLLAELDVPVNPDTDGSAGAVVPHSLKEGG
jgi:4-hydroxy-tetrahydrodipicolinate synthase